MSIAVRIRTTNLIERTFGESRRRTKVIPYFYKEQAGINLVFATLITASKKWRGVHINPAIQLELAKNQAAALRRGTICIPK